MFWKFRRDSMARTWAEEDIAVLLLPPETRTTGSLSRWRVRKRPVVGSARTMRSLKELVPRSIAAKRWLSPEETVAKGEIRGLVAMV